MTTRRTIEAVYEAYDLGQVPVIQFPRPQWEMAPTGDFDVVTFRLSVAPNAFHRLMQRVFFGFVWRKLK